MPLFCPSRRALLAAAVLPALGRPRAEAQAGDSPPAVPQILTLQPGTLAAAEQAAAVPIWGIAGETPGPTLRAVRGGEVVVRVVNELPEPAALHWHGVRLRNAMDGAPPLTQAAIPPGGSLDYRFTCPDAGTFFYRAAARDQLGRGLAGALIVEEPGQALADRDLVLLFQDLLPPAAAGNTPGAPVATLNGRLAQRIAVRPHERLRLRLINGGLGVVVLTFEGLKLTVVAIDGQPCEVMELGQPQLVLPPGRRIDLYADVPAAAADPVLRRLTATSAPVVATFAIDRDAPARPAPLGEVAPLPDPALPRSIEMRGAIRAELILDGDFEKSAQGTDVPNERKPPLLRIPRGRPVVLALANRLPEPLVVHLHGHHFRLLDDLDDGWKPWWHDTLLVPGGRTSRIAFVADNPGKWRIEAAALDGPETLAPAWLEVS